MSQQLIPAETVLRPGVTVKVQAAGSDTVHEGVLEEIGKLFIVVALDDMPMEDYINAPEPETRIELRIIADSALYLAAGGYRGNAPLPRQMWFIDRPDFVVRQQQREYVRVPALLPIRVRTKNIYGTFNDAQETTSLDISGGGLCFANEAPLTVPMTIGLIIEDLPGLETFPITADAVRCQTVINNTGNTVYHVGVTFEPYLSRPLRARLLHAITALQRAALSRGMGIK
ncbi:MAG: PilZ domain-containing protein [Schwartzia sp.]|nr:PilZ domain-containing protein [Schwartzia sp. (in: firmicutes)]